MSILLERKAQFEALLPENTGEWNPIDDQDWQKRLEHELQRELESNVNHVLFGLTVMAIATGWQDDVLFAVDNEDFHYAGVHLTWTKRRERAPWPTAWTYRNIQDLSEIEAENFRKTWEFINRNKKSPESSPNADEDAKET